jgi:threonine/homoserine/homoserine lactone efflux protein
MSVEVLLSLLVFCVSTLFTPGPNNMMLMTSGLNYGIRRSLPHYWGVNLGFTAMVLLVGLGLGRLFETAPILFKIIKYAGAVYLLYLTYKIATATPAEPDAADSKKPISFLEAAAFQWVNPKAWVMAVGAVTAYAAVAAFPYNMLIIALTFGVLGMASSGTWVGFGSGLRHFLKNPNAVRVFNILMAVALVASLWPVLAEVLSGG